MGRVHEEEGGAHQGEAEHLRSVVEPIACFVVGEVALVACDRAEAEEEDNGIDLEGLDGHPCAGLELQYVKEQHHKGETARGTPQCHQEGEVAVTQHMVHEEQERREAYPRHDVLPVADQYRFQFPVVEWWNGGAGDLTTQEKNRLNIHWRGGERRIVNVCCIIPIVLWIFQSLHIDRSWLVIHYLRES